MSIVLTRKSGKLVLVNWGNVLTAEPGQPADGSGILTYVTMVNGAVFSVQEPIGKILELLRPD